MPGTRNSAWQPRAVTFWLLLAVLALALAGCGGARAAATPTPTKTPGGAADAPAGTPTPLPDPGQPATQPAQPVASQPTPTPQTETIATVNTDLLNIRSEPSTTGTILRTATTGEQFTVVATSADGLWRQLAANGQPLGWASAEFLTISTREVAVSAEAQAPGAPQPTPPAVAAGNFLPATMTSPDYGAQAFLWWREEIADRDLDLMRDAGFNWVKQTFAWETIEGAGRGVFDWTVADRVVTHVNQKGLKLLARLSIDPDKAVSWMGTPPANADLFAEYAGAVAQRYNCQPGAIGCIQAFQIWNEPNLAREWGGARPNPAEYAAFLRKAYAAIKAVHPTAIVINAGMAPTGDDGAVAMPDDKFYDLMYQAMGGSSDGYFDMLGVHGAGYAAPPELDPAEAAADKARYGGYRFFAFRHVEDIRAIMERYGDAGKQIVLLEFGWTFDRVNPAYKWHGADAGITDAIQADYLKRAYQYAGANWPWVGLMSMLTMPNLDWLNDGNPQDEEQYWWAIMEPSPIDQKYWRPAYIVLCIYFQEEIKGGVCPYNPNR
jgi:polysaccharide biosynthesis protein PslG